MEREELLREREGHVSTINALAEERQQQAQLLSQLSSRLSRAGTPSTSYATQYSKRSVSRSSSRPPTVSASASPPEFMERDTSFEQLEPSLPRHELAGVHATATSRREPFKPPSPAVSVCSHRSSSDANPAVFATQHVQDALLARAKAVVHSLNVK
jgi:hypothetical protein